MGRSVPSARRKAGLVFTGFVGASPLKPWSPPLLVACAWSGASDALPVKAKRFVRVGSGGFVVFAIVTLPQLRSGIATGVTQSFGSDVMLVDERLCMNTEPNAAHG